MANEALLIYKKAGVSEESTWAQGTVTDATALLPLRDSGVAIGLAAQQIAPARIGNGAGLREMRLGTIAPALSVPMFGYPVGPVLKFLKAGLGQVTSTETASFIVQAGVNDKIDFTEDGGAEVTATLTAGTYKAGTSSADAGTLCALIKTQMEAVNGASTYTVAFSTSTKKFTITKSAGVFVLKWATGTNAATAADTLLGFAADTASAIAATSATALEIVYSHAITIKEALDYGATKGLTLQIALATGKVFDITDAVVQSLNISYAPNQELYIDAAVEARKVADSIATMAALATTPVQPMMFNQLVFSVNGTPAAISALSVVFNNTLKSDLFVNSAYRSRFPRNGYRAVAGSFAFDLTDSVTYALYDAFLADSSAGIPLIATFTGAVIKGAFSYGLVMTLPKARPKFENVPGGGGAAAPAGEVAFDALDDAATGEINFTVTNNEASI